MFFYLSFFLFLSFFLSFLRFITSNLIYFLTFFLSKTHIHSHTSLMPKVSTCFSFLFCLSHSLKKSEQFRNIGKHETTTLPILQKDISAFQKKWFYSDYFEFFYYNALFVTIKRDEAFAKSKVVVNITNLVLVVKVFNYSEKNLALVCQSFFL
jgi:hypothetical protein